MSQILNITIGIHDNTTVRIPYSQISAIKSVQILHNCNRNHDKVIKINCSLLENEENYGVLGHIFTKSKLDINEDTIWCNVYTDAIRFWLSDSNDSTVTLDEDIYVNMQLLID